MRPALSAADVLWILRHLWPRLARVANLQGDPLRGEIVGRLERILRNQPPLPGGLARAPLGLVCRDDGVEWCLVLGESAEDAERELRLALVLLWHPAARGLLRKCSGCRAFLLRKARRLGAPDFCEDACRARTWRKKRTQKGR